MSSNTQKINVTLNSGNFFDGWDMVDNAGLQEAESITNFATMLENKIATYYPEVAIAIEVENKIAAKTYTVDVENFSSQQEDEINNEIVHIMNELANVSDRWTVYEN